MSSCLKKGRERTFGKILAVTTSLLIALTILSSWLACDGVRLVANVEDDSVLYDVFFAIIAGMCVISAATFAYCCYVLKKLNDDVAEARRETDDIARSIMHSLGSPLSLVKTDLEFLMMGEGEMKTVCKDCVSVVDSLIKLVSIRTEIQRMNHRSHIAPAKHFDFTSTICQQAPRYVTSAKSRNLRIDFTLPQEPIEMAGHEGKLVMILDNLIGNAIKYNKPGGSISVSVSTKHDGRRRILEISVEDTGIGMTEEELAKMYNEFYRGKRASVEDGFGEGLALVKAVVLFYDGDILCSSAPDNGTKFTVRLPYYSQK